MSAEAWGALGLWVISFHVLATVPLAWALTDHWSHLGPGQRLARTWAVTIGLLLLGLLLALPGWPRPLLPSPSVGPIATEATSTLTMLGGGFAIGAGLVAAWLTFGAASALGLVCRSRQAPPFVQALLRRLVLGRAPRVRSHDRVTHPLVLGLVRPTILLPSALPETTTPARLVPLLKHECAHVRHGDLWLLALMRLLLVGLFAHPLYHRFRTAARDDQELLADAAAADGQPLEYAQALLDWSREHPSSPVAFGLAFTPRRSQLQRRVAALLTERPCPPVHVRHRLTVAISVLAMVGLLATLSPRLPTSEPIVAPDCPVAVAGPSRALVVAPEHSERLASSLPVVGPSSDGTSMTLKPTAVHHPRQGERSARAELTVVTPWYLSFAWMALQSFFAQFSWSFTL